MKRKRPAGNGPDDGASGTASATNYHELISKPMAAPQRKALLRQLQSPTVISSLRRPEILMDFFTDSLNLPDISICIPALTGLFHLITTRNLDYPSFFPRLYSLLTPSLLHSKHRSRFLRHLETFLSPTNHLPATTIASFIKRLSRLSLSAPPSAIVAIVPFIYNLLRQYPATTYLIHRQPYPPYTKTTTELGIDPYNPSEEDPQLTNAIDSSLWELETLQSHYHPTVSQIAKIISEQFTKPFYNLEDFLDHGYGTMMESELKKEIKKEPVVEWRIPKKVFWKDEEEKGQNVLLDLWSFD